MKSVYTKWNEKLFEELDLRQEDRPHIFHCFICHPWSSNNYSQFCFASSIPPKYTPYVFIFIGPPFLFIPFMLPHLFLPSPIILQKCLLTLAFDSSMYLKTAIHHLLWRSTNKCKTIITKLFLKVLSHPRQFHEDMLKGFVLFVSALGITKGNRRCGEGIVNHRLLWNILFVSRVFCLLWTKKFKVLFKTILWWPLLYQKK